MTLIQFIELTPPKTAHELWILFGSKMNEDDFVKYLKKLAYRDKKIERRFEPYGKDGLIARYYPIKMKESSLP